MKRFLTTLSILAGLAVLLTVSGCDLSEVNEDPNEPTEVNTASVFTNTMTDLTDTYWGTFNSGRFGIIYAQYWSQNFYTDESQYRFRPGIPNDIWQESYTSLNDLETIKELNRAGDGYSAYGSPNNQIAAAMILQVWTWQNLTDIFGPVPFEEALQGSENFTPGYAMQKDIYPKLVDSLDVAIGLIEPSADGPTGDVMFEGDMEKWARFANSLKMRVGMRMSEVNETEAREAVTSALTSTYGPMQSNGDNATFQFDGSSPHWNPFYVNFEIDDRDDWFVSQNLTSLMNQYDDPRRSSFMKRGGTGFYKGFPYGLQQSQAQQTTISEGSTFSPPSERVTQAQSNFIFMLYDEVKFIETEAQLRGWVSGNASSTYEEAIRGSMEYWGVTSESAITAYLDAIPALSGSLDSDSKNALGRQKWLALYMQGFQGWAEWRRLDFTGVLTPPAAGAGVPLCTDAEIAVRMVYPSDEKSLNSANVNKAIESDEFGTAGDVQGARVWWDTALAN